MDKRPKVSKEEREKRKPLPQEILASALQDRIHEPSGRPPASRPVKVVKLPKT